MDFAQCRVQSKDRWTKTTKWPWALSEDSDLEVKIWSSLLISLFIFCWKKDYYRNENNRLSVLKTPYLLIKCHLSHGPLKLNRCPRNLLDHMQGKLEINWQLIRSLLGLHSRHPFGDWGFLKFFTRSQNPGSTFEESRILMFFLDFWTFCSRVSNFEVISMNLPLSWDWLFYNYVSSFQ